MHCSKATWQLQLYLDQQLNLQQIRSLEAHLAVCPACSASLHNFEEVGLAIRHIAPVVEPADLTVNVMRRVAISARQVEQQRIKRSYVLFRPSLLELLTAILLATVTMLGIILEQPTLRAALPIANGHDPLSQVFINVWGMLIGINSGTLMLGFWVIGTLLGIWITLALAGGEMRTLWFRSVMDRLPVW